MHFVKKSLTAAGGEVGFPQPRKDAFSTDFSDPARFRSAYACFLTEVGDGGNGI